MANIAFQFTPITLSGAEVSPPSSRYFDQYATASTNGIKIGTISFTVTDNTEGDYQLEVIPKGAKNFVLVDSGNGSKDLYFKGNADSLGQAMKSMQLTPPVQVVDKTGLDPDTYVFDKKLTAINHDPVTTATNLFVREGSTAGTVAANLRTEDPDADNKKPVYSIENVPTDANGSPLFAVDGDRIVTTAAGAAAIDFEKITSYTLTVVTTDGFKARGGADGVSKQSVTILIGDDVVDNAHAPIDIIPSNTKVLETAAVGTVVANLKTIDPDSPLDSHTYKVLDNDKFTIHGDQLVIAKSVRLPICEAKDGVEYVTVETKDSTGLTYTEKLAINVQDVVKADAKKHLHGGSGADKLVGGDNNDEIEGGNGNDTIIAGAGDDEIEGGCGDDYLHACDGNDEVEAGWGNDTVLGGNGNDEIEGCCGNDLLLGEAGNDEIEGGGDNDTLIGGAGADKLKGGCGVDTADYATSPAAINVTLDWCVVGKGGDAEGDRLHDIENVIGSNFDDAIKGNCCNNVLDGGKGNDTLTSGGGCDTLIGGEGNDTLVLSDCCVGKVDGGIGFDTLKLVKPMVLDLVGGKTATGYNDGISSKFAGIEAIDMRNHTTCGDTLKLDINDVFNLPSAGSDLRVMGDKVDKVYLLDDTATWSNTGKSVLDGVSYNTYVGKSLATGVSDTLFVQDTMNVLFI